MRPKWRLRTGLPCGPGELVPPGTGFALPMGTRAEIVERLRACFTSLAGDAATLRRLGQAAQEHVYRHFTWEAKALQTLAVYDWVTGRRNDKPDFGRPIR